MEPAQLEPDQTTAIGRLLHFASQGDVEAVEKVLDDSPKVPVDSQDYDGRTAMHLAASEGHRDVIELLLKRAANVNPVDRWRKTPLADARRYEAVNAKIIKNRQIYQEVCNLLVRHGGSTSSPFEIDKDELTYVQDLRKCSFGGLSLANWRGTIVQAREMNRLEEQDSPKSDGPNLTKQLSLLQKLRHPNIVQFLGAVQAKREPLVLITEYLPKGCLLELLRQSKNGRLPHKEAMNYALDIARGMNYLHQHKPEEVVHCDLNPMNLLRDDGGHLKVAGLHLAEIQSICTYGKYVFKDDEPMMHSSNLADTVRRYRAPEITSANREKPDGSADVYSFGMIVKEMFEGQSLARRQAQKAGGPRQMKKAEQQDAEACRLYPLGMQKILQTCCDRDPKKRPRFEKILGELEKINITMTKKTYCIGFETVKCHLLNCMYPEPDRQLKKLGSVYSVESQKSAKLQSTGADGRHATHGTILE